jgi:hypothetical protein
MRIALVVIAADFARTRSVTPSVSSTMSPWPGRQGAPSRLVSIWTSLPALSRDFERRVPWCKTCRPAETGRP